MTVRAGARGARVRVARRIVGASLAVVLAACGSPSANPAGPTAAVPSADGSATPTASARPSTTPAASAPTATASGQPARAVGLALVVDGLESPVLAETAGDGSGRLFVVEQPGRIRLVRDGRLVAKPFLDITGRVSSGGERGLLGLAFSPTFAADGTFYVDYTDTDGNTVVSELRAPVPAADTADPASERALLRIRQPYPNHNGGGLVIGPDRMLWIAAGDGGSAGDPQGNGQRLDTLLGKLLRIDPRPSGAAPYAIPADNPFVGRSNARGEIWAYGLRNPWRFSFDRATGDLWIGDVGQDRFEEIDHWPAGSPAGPNFGWNTMEGRACFDPATGCRSDGLVLPVAVYGHDRGCAVTGGYVYRGAAIPALVGTYLFSDYCSGTIWGLDAAAADPTARVLSESRLAVSSFGADDAGELFLTDLSGGRVYRVVAAP